MFKKKVNFYIQPLERTPMSNGANNSISFTHIKKCKKCKNAKITSNINIKHLKCVPYLYDTHIYAKIT